MKVCTKCGDSKPATSEYFSIHGSSFDRLRCACKSCDKEYYKKNKERKARVSKEYYENNKEKVLAANKKYREENRDKITTQRKENYIKSRNKILAWNREYHHKNKNKRSEYNKLWREKNKDYVKSRLKEYYENNKETAKKKAAEYREANKEKVTEGKKKHYQNNRQHIIEINSQYHRENKERYTIIRARRRSKKHQLPSTLTPQQWGDIKRAFNNQCCYCGEVVQLTQEHFVSIKNGGEYGKDNILPACRSCNSSKNAHDPFVWYPKFKHYSPQREQRILKYLGYKNGIQQLSIL